MIMNGANPQMGGFNYQGMGGITPPMTKFSNNLTADEIKQLQQKVSQFSMGLTNEERLRGICNHRNADGTEDALVFDPQTGVATCTICGYEFRPIEPDVSLESISADVDRIVDILQTIKLMYVDLPADASREYFTIIPLIEKIPRLFEYAAKNMNKHELNNWMYRGGNMGAVAMFNNLNNMFGGGMAPQMAMPQQAPMAMNPAFGMPQAPMGMNPAFGMNNGFGYPGAGMAPQMGYAPATNGFQFTPGVTPAAPVAPTTAPVPAAPVATEETTVTQTVNA